MVERVAFATRGSDMDEFYLPEDIAEWLGLKKSEYLSKLIENLGPHDFQFDEYHRFEDLIMGTLSHPDWSVEILEDNQNVKTFCKLYLEPERFHQMIVGVLIADQNQQDVFVPILSFVTREESLVKIFSGGKIVRPILN